MGDLISHYRLDHVIGVGGMGQVFGAQDQRLSRSVALKVVLGQFAESEDFVRRFEREAATLARLDSPHVISIYDHGVHEGLPFIVTQYAAGGDLGRRLRERGPMPVGLASLVCSQVADGLAAAHGVGVVHRDVKPANVLLRDDRVDRMHVYLCDFGVALTDSGGLTTPGAVAGTWNYLAPERSNGDPGSPASDLYSVGCLLWELLTGAPPYAGSDVEVAMAHLNAPVPQLPGADPVTAELNRILAGTLAKAPEHRYPSAALLRDDLRALSERTTHGLSGTGASPVRTVGRGALVGAGIAAIALTVGAVVGVVAVANQDDGEPVAVETSAPPTDPGTSGVPDGTESTDAPTDPSSEDPTEDPSDPSDPSSGGIGSVSGPVPGDLDGDGIGDLVVSGSKADFSGDVFYVRTSDGTSFGKTTQEPLDRYINDTLSANFDGDDARDLMQIDGFDEQRTVTTFRSAGGKVTSGLTIPKVVEKRQFDRDVLAADVDGDGTDDLVFAAPDGKGLILSVALNRGDGSFDPVEEWLSTTDVGWEDTGWAIGDFDGDGLADLVAGRYLAYTADAGEAIMLRSTGTSFEVSGEPLAVPHDVPGTIIVGMQFAAGDVDGDGSPELLGIDPHGFAALVWTWTGSAFEDQAVWADGNDDRGGGALTPMISDVNGDGLADVVSLGTDAVVVNVSTGSSFEYAPDFTLKVDFDGGDFPGSVQELVSPVSLGVE